MRTRSLIWGTLLVLLTVAIYAIRLTGPSDLEADAQQRNIAYVMDAAWRGNWSAQTEVRGWLMSKPPLHTWMASGLAEVGGINRLTLTLPSAFAVLAMTLLVYRIGRRRFGEAAGIYAGLAFVLAPMISRHIALVRTDALFALAIALTAFAALRAWEKGGGWVPFWVAAAAATLVKGPLGLVLGAAGLLGCFWERPSDPAAPMPHGLQRMGILLFLGVTLGWLALAVHSHGYALIDKLFFEELFGQVTGMRKDITPGENLYKPFFFYLLRFAPFSLFVAWALWRVARHPAGNVAERRIERFLFAWLTVGLLLFALGAHFRADLLLPLWPAGALLAGREMACLANRAGSRVMVSITALVSVVLLGAAYWNYHPKSMKSKEVLYSVETDRAGRALAASGIDPYSIWHLDTPPTVIMHLGIYRPWITEGEALQRANENFPACLALTSPEKYPILFGAAGSILQETFRWPEGGGQKAVLSVFCNPAFMQSSRHVRPENSR